MEFPVQNAVRWGLLLAAVGTAGFRLPGLVRYFRYWREALRLGDTSGAQGWQTYWCADAVGLLIVLAIGLLAFYLLRPRAKSGP